MPLCFIKRNETSSTFFSLGANARFLECFYDRNVPRPIHPDWYLAEWLQTLHMKQARLSERTGWDRRKTSFLVTGRQPYTRESVNEAAAALNLAPFELLLQPEEAMAIRRMRESAVRIAAETPSDYVAEPTVLDGTRG